jgi:hypothetical protein
MGYPDDVAARRELDHYIDSASVTSFPQDLMELQQPHTFVSSLQPNDVVIRDPAGIADNARVRIKTMAVKP